MKRLCVEHGIPDCSPMLNGCSRLSSTPRTQAAYELLPHTVNALDLHLFEELTREKVVSGRLLETIIKVTSLGEPHLGLATTRQLIEELEAREQTGHTHLDYRPVDSE